MAERIITGNAYLERIRPPKAGRADYRDSKVRGLSLRVSHTGKMLWTLRARLDDRQQRFEIGHYSDSETGLSLAMARRQAEDWKRRILAGDDPREDVRAAKARKKETFADVRDRFIRQYVGRNLKPNTQAAYKNAFHHRRFRDWEPKPIKSISRGDVIAIIDGIAEEGSLVMANRQLAYLRRFFNWCAEKDIIRKGEPIPTDGVKPPLKKEKPRERFLSPAEIRLLWEATAELDYPYGPVFRLFLVTGQRKTECAEIRRQDIENGLWQQSENKADRQHLVPLNAPALATIESCPRIGEAGYLFTTRGDRPINGFSKSKARLDTKIAEIAKRQGIEGAFDEPWQIHDLRRTMTTHLRKAGIGRDVCSLLLNHAEKGVTAENYDEYDMLPEKQRAMAAWAGLLNEFIYGGAGNVVRLLDSKEAESA